MSRYPSFGPNPTFGPNPSFRPNPSFGPNPSFRSNPSYPYGPNPSYSYDHNLIAHAPTVTRADRQAGYDIGIIERGVVPYPPPNQAPNPFTDTLTNRLDKELPSRPTAVDAPSPVPSYKYRWYRTKRGIAIILLIVLILISVIVGVAVGVSGEQKRQAAIAATQTAAVGAADADPTTSGTVISASSPLIPSTTTSDKPTNRPLSTSLGPVHPTSMHSLSLITPTTGNPQATRPLTTIPSSSSTSSSSGNQGNAGQETSFFCRVFPFLC